MKAEDARRIHLDNIREFSGREKLSSEQRLLSVSELIDLFVEEKTFYSPKDAYRDFMDFFPESTPKDRAIFLSRLFSDNKLNSEFVKLQNQNEYASIPGAHGKIAIVKNKYNEDAFALLSKSVTRPKAIHFPSFSEACEAVLDNQCQFCILPTESSEGGRLFGFYSMLDKYELKIFAVCFVDTDSGTESIRYALVGRSSPDRMPRLSKRTLECSLITDSGDFPTDIPEILNVFGAKISRIDSIPIEYDDLRQKYYLTFSLSEKFAIPLDLYLSTEYPRYFQIGLYPTVER